ncbi:MAG TPA: tetratricopeptide repeat protein [Candidatus Binatia bacterium]|nr:tetratricopeptide repeat protein [Candidatus Sulfotelmatobacter sp.]HXJ86790.1 tetratricopeptide repeat protein [Candidatus Binatia bacterium]
MSRRLRLSWLLLACCCGSSGSEKQETWLEIRSPHFVVVTNSNEKQGRRVADQFERMRSVFHVAFPLLQIDPGTPIIILAVKDEKDFRALEPEAYLAKGSLKLGGLFLRAADKNYVLMRLGAEGDHPYAVVYHEYTHLLLSKADWMPLWMSEGLAEFYQNTDITDKRAALGQVSADNILWLRQNQLLPLPMLFAVDHSSPYYHEEKKGSIFYAESWALMHYLEISDFKDKAGRITEYGALLAKNVDAVNAATKAFGDLEHLQSNLEAYIRSGRYNYFTMTTTTEVDDSAFKVQPLAPTQSAALRADFLAYNERTADAQALLDRVLQDDPKNVSARETKGHIALRQGQIDEARKWYGEAVQLDSQSYLAHYYFAAMSINHGGDSSQESKIEASLRAAIRLNPTFAPALDTLAIFLATQHKNLEEAHMMALQAISLDPTNVAYRLNVAHILMMMESPDSAIAVLKAAGKFAKTPEQTQMIADALTRVQEYAEMKAKFGEKRKAYGIDQNVSVENAGENRRDVPVPRLRHRDFVPKGPHLFAVGVLKAVSCQNPELDLILVATEKQISLHSDNYFKVPYTALGFEPTKDLNPCTDLENRPAKVEYVESANPSVAAQLVSVELHK